MVCLFQSAFCNQVFRGEYSRAHWVSGLHLRHAALLLLLCGTVLEALPAETATGTSLAITSGEGIAITVTGGTVVTLTATVKAGVMPVTSGQVNFCAAAAKYCTDIHILGMAQLTSTGTATFRFRPRVGSESYTAHFLGTASNSASDSSAVSLSVISAGAYPTHTSIAHSGYAGNYMLTATVGGPGPISPSSTVSFIDTTDGNAVLASSSLGVGTGFPSFFSEPGTFLTPFVVGDFNGDGVPDLAAGGSPVTVLLGNGDGTFTAAPISSPPASGQTLQIGDFNGDGILDLAVGGSPITILLGKGDGTFTAAPISVPSLAGHILQIGDFNLDGIPDLAVGGSPITILLGRGDGTFAAAPISTPSMSGEILQEGDFTGDGIPDLVMVNAAIDEGVHGFWSQYVSIAFGKGNGTFSAPSNIYGLLGGFNGDILRSLVIADFNRDGNLDLAVGNIFDGAVHVLLGDGRGNFSEGAGSIQVAGPIAVALGDFNGDGLPDLAVTTLANVTEVFQGNLDGGFTRAATIPQAGLQAAAKDLNGDGFSDLILDGTVLVAAPQSTTATATGISLPLATGTHLVRATYTGDSIYLASDSATTSLLAAKAPPMISVVPSANPTFYGAPLTLTANVTGSGIPPTGTVIFLYGSTQLAKQTLNGGSATYSSSASSLGFHSVAVTYSGDANYIAATSAVLTEVVIPTRDAVTTTALSATAASGPLASIAAGSPVTLTATVEVGQMPVTLGTVSFCDAPGANCTGVHLLGSAQLTPNGTAAIALRLGIGMHMLEAIFNGTPGNGFSNSTELPFLVTGKYATITSFTTQGTLLAAQVHGVGPSNSLYPGGPLQFIDTNFSNAVLATGPLAIANYQAAFFRNQAQTAVTGIKPFSIRVGDFNRDGIPDLVVANSNENTVSILIGNGDGTYKTQMTYAAGMGAFSVAVGDFNSDGSPDLAVTNFSDDTLSILLGRGDGTFQSQQAFVTGGGPDAIVVADFNGDGNLDVAVANQLDATVSVFLGNGDGSFATQQIYLTGRGPASVATGDFNGDGISDLVVANNADGTLSMMMGNGDGSFKTQVSYSTGSHPNSVTMGGFTGSGNLDLAVGNLSDNTVSVLIGNGDGTFQRQRIYPTGISPYAVIAGDLAGEGHLDLAVLNSGDNTVTVLINEGHGAFTAKSTNGTSPGSISLALADLNGDGLQDLAVLNNARNSVTVMLNGSGPTSKTAALTLALPGRHVVEAIYSGDSNFDGSNSATSVQNNSTVATVLSLRSSSNPSNYGTAVTLSATLSPYSVLDVSSNGSPVTFGNGNTILGIGTLSSGKAILETSTLPVGMNSVQARFAGTAYFGASSSTAFSLTVRPATLTVTGPNVSRPYGRPNPALTGIFSGAVNGDAFTVTGTTTATPASQVGTYPVVLAVSGSNIANYTVTAVNGNLTVTKATPVLSWSTPSAVTVGTALGATQLNATANVAGSFSYNPAIGTVISSVGNNTLTANFVPTDTTDYGTASTTVILAVNSAARITPTVTLVPSATTITDQQSVTVTASVTSGSELDRPSGTLTLASGTYKAQLTLASGAASFTISAGTLSSGSNTLIATYDGDARYAIATGTTTVTVSTVTITVPAPSPLPPGGSATATATISASGSYSGTMDLTCTLTGSPNGAVSLPTCSPNQARITLTAGESATLVWIVKTTAAPSSELGQQPNQNLWKIGGGATVLAAMLFLGIPSRRRRWITMITLLFVVLVGGASGCGGGGGVTSPVNPVTPATTSGEYIFTLAGVDAANSTIKSSTTLTITVQ